MIKYTARSQLCALRLLLAALAVVGQLLIGAVVPVAAAESQGPALLGLPYVICHAPDNSGAPDSRHDRRSTDCAICPLCVSLAPVAAVLSVPPRLPVRVAIIVVRAFNTPIAAAPPAFFHDIPPPRGPPALT